MKQWFSNLPMHWWIKFWGTLVALVFGVMFTVPTFLGEVNTWPKWATSVFPQARVALGLDLKGGLHLVLEVDVEKSLRESLTRSVNRARELSMDKGIKTSDMVVESDYSATVMIEDSGKTKEFVEAVRAQTMLLAFDKEVGKKLHFLPIQSRIDDYSSDVLKQAINTIRNRIDQFNVAEPSIMQQGSRRIIVQMPGLQDPERAKQLIGNTAQLDFRLVLNEVTEDKVPQLVIEARTALNIPEDDTKPETMRTISQWLRDNGKITSNATIMLARTMGATDKGMRVVESFPYLVEANSKLTGELIENATVVSVQDSIQQALAVSLSFKPQGAKIFGELTTEAVKPVNVPHKIAIVLDENVQSAPTVENPIMNGQAQITMGSRGADYDKKYKEAQDLALVLKAGALPASVRIIEERQVGPSEGEENIRMGLYSSVISGAIVIVFMIFVYGNAGIVANIGMLFNVLIILAFLAAFGATLTLPGIAGIVLTMAVAVDGNVIINERIREELRNGVPAKQAFYRGYGESFETLLDAHVTSAVAGIVLLAYGNPAIKGFAITTLIGIFSTLFTSYYVTEVIGMWLLEKTRIKRFH